MVNDAAPSLALARDAADSNSSVSARVLTPAVSSKPQQLPLPSPLPRPVPSPGPPMVNVLPLPVCPYANMHTLYPSRMPHTSGLNSSYTCPWVESGPNTLSKEKRFSSARLPAGRRSPVADSLPGGGVHTTSMPSAAGSRHRPGTTTAPGPSSLAATGRMRVYTRMAPLRSWIWLYSWRLRACSLPLRSVWNTFSRSRLATVSHARASAVARASTNSLWRRCSVTTVSSRSLSFDVFISGRTLSYRSSAAASFSFSSTAFIIASCASVASSLFCSALALAWASAIVKASSTGGCTLGDCRGGVCPDRVLFSSNAICLLCKSTNTLCMS
mmetsp:Transcript_28458/g.70129  ORF Transcript_28458/g.70129 Transcript_28458/m.70129 type:complete len:328 (+) Transcript_28458:417-1400(+)